MTKPRPQAAGQSGHEPIVATEARARPGTEAQPSTRSGAPLQAGAPPKPEGEPKPDAGVKRGGQPKPDAPAKSGAPPEPGPSPAVAPPGPRAVEPPDDGAALDLRLEEIRSDDEFRRYTAARLAKSLDNGVGLITQARYLAAQPARDRVNPLGAAARLMDSNARLAREIARLVHVEQRHRTIVERIQLPVPALTGSNSTSAGTLGAELCLKMLRYMNIVAAETFDGTIKQADAAAKNSALDHGAAEGEARQD